MSRFVALAPLLLLVACSKGEIPLGVQDLEITVETPEYGDFVDDDVVWIQGKVNFFTARVFVEDEEVPVSMDGTFFAEVPLDHAYRNVDIVATLGDISKRERIPVFRGQDPVETWPGGITARVTSAGLQAIGDTMGPAIDAIGWEQSVVDALPSTDNSFLSVQPIGLTHEPTVVSLTGADGGIETGITWYDLTIEMEVTLDFGGNSFTVPVWLGYEQVELGALLVPTMSEEGILALELTDPALTFADPIVMIDDFDLVPVELLLGLVSGVVDPLGELLLDFVLDGFGTFELGGPFDFSTDLLGTPLEISLSDVYGEPVGLGADLKVGLGEPIDEGPLPYPAPSGADESHLALGLHEALVDQMFSSTATDLLSQDIELSGPFALILTAGISALPGGGDAPDVDGWCLSLEPGEAKVVRLQDGLEPWAVWYLPDARFTVSALDGGCQPWLEASLAVEVGLKIEEGTQIEMDLNIAEGAVLYYGTTEEWEEDEVVSSLSTLVSSFIGLAGNNLSFDLADMLGAGDLTGDDSPLGGIPLDLSLSIIDSRAQWLEDGTHPEGLYALSLSLFETTSE